MNLGQTVVRRKGLNVRRQGDFLISMADAEMESTIYLISCLTLYPERRSIVLAAHRVVAYVWSHQLRAIYGSHIIPPFYLAVLCNP